MRRSPTRTGSTRAYGGEIHSRQAKAPRANWRSGASPAHGARLSASHAVQANPLVAEVRDHLDLAAEGLDVLA
jgi:hypothetical protein